MLCCLYHKREAKVHLSYSSDRPAAKAMEIIDLCEECARKHGVNDKAGFSLADLLIAVEKARQSSNWP
jgi:hypothetical protein